MRAAPIQFEGSNALSRSIEYNGRTYNVQDTIASKADLAEIFAGYQFDLISRPKGHAGLQVGGAYLDATGTIASASTGISASRSQRTGLPLAGAEFRAFLISSILSVSGEVKGMAPGGYGHCVQATGQVGIGYRGISFQAGYQIIDADPHENNSGANPVGIAPRISGPVFGQFRG